jgi:hypothetical protein
MYHLLRIKKELSILPTQCTYVLHKNLTVNSDYFPKQR